jgi:hypothetical protein
MTRGQRPRVASRLVSIRDAGTRLGLGRTRLNALLDHGDLASITIGSRRLILTSSLEEFVANQQKRAARDGRVRVPPQEAKRGIP